MFNNDGAIKDAILILLNCGYLQEYELSRELHYKTLKMTIIFPSHFHMPEPAPRVNLVDNYPQISDTTHIRSEDITVTIME